MEHYGYIAATATACFWSLTSMFFAAGGRQIGSFTVNQIRIVMAVVLLMCMHFLMLGTFWPVTANSSQIGLFALSGIIGLAIGDSGYFAALVLLGAKRAAVMMILHVPIAAILAWPILGEDVTVFTVLGMIITATGIITVINAGNKNNKQHANNPRYGLGIVFGLIGATGQGMGIVIAKMGLTDFNPLSGTLIRMCAAAIILWLIAVIQVYRAHKENRTSEIVNGIRNRKGLLYTFGGAVFGPFLGVWCSLISVKYAPVAITTTIMATFPIFIIPQTMIIYREKPLLMEIAGAFIAVAGVAILFLPDFLGL